MNRLFLMLAVVASLISSCMVYGLVFNIFYKVSPAHAIFLVLFSLMNYISRLIVQSSMKELESGKGSTKN